MDKQRVFEIKIKPNKMTLARAAYTMYVIAYDSTEAIALMEERVGGWNEFTIREIRGPQLIWEQEAPLSEGVVSKMAYLEKELGETRNAWKNDKDELLKQSQMNEYELWRCQRAAEGDSTIVDKEQSNCSKALVAVLELRERFDESMRQEDEELDEGEGDEVEPSSPPPSMM